MSSNRLGDAAIPGTVQYVCQGSNAIQHGTLARALSAWGREAP